MIRLLLLLLFSSFLSNPQKIEDSKIIVTVPDTIGIYKKVKVALVNADFIVKDNYNLDTLTTYSREFTSMSGHCVAMAIIQGNTVTISGYYSLKRLDWFGFTQSSNSFQKVLYYKSSKSWDLLMKVAEGIEGKLSFAK